MADDEKDIEETTDEVAEVPAETEAAAVEEAPAEEAAPEAPADEAAPEAPAEEAAPEAPADEAAPEAPAAKTKSRRHVPRTERRQRSKPAREKTATRKPITRTEKPASELGRRQERRGVVVSDKGDKTIVVKVDVIKSHPKYKKVVRRSVRFHAHDEQNTAGVGDTVRIVETRPLSKTKCWRLAEVVEKAR
jgi:small subunit ribosomal protein S17